MLIIIIIIIIIKYNVAGNILIKNNDNGSIHYSVLVW